MGYLALGIGPLHSTTGLRADYIVGGTPVEGLVIGRVPFHAVASLLCAGNVAQAATYANAPGGAVGYSTVSRSLAVDC